MSTLDASTSPKTLVANATYYLLSELPEELSKRIKDGLVLQHGADALLQGIHKAYGTLLDASIAVQNLHISKNASHPSIVHDPWVMLRSLFLERLEQCFLQNLPLRASLDDIFNKPSEDGDDIDLDEHMIEHDSLLDEKFFSYIDTLHGYTNGYFIPVLDYVSSLSSRPLVPSLRERFLKRLDLALFEHQELSNREPSLFDQTLKEAFYTLYTRIERAKSSGDDRAILDSLRRFSKCCAQLVALYLYETRACPAFSSLVAQHILDEKLESQCAGRFSDEDALASLQHWLRFVVFPLVDTFLAYSTSRTADSIKQQFENLLVLKFARLRCSEFFDICIHWPDSEPALLDLKHSLTRARSMQPVLAKSLLSSLENRLLQAGASTFEIVNLYITIIRALHIAEPSGSTLAAIAPVVSHYLQHRPDAVRHIVKQIAHTEGQLFDELRESTLKRFERAEQEMLGDAVEDDEVIEQDPDDDISENWMPKSSSAKLPTRSSQPIDDALDQSMQDFSTRAEPDVIHWLLQVFPQKQPLIDYYTSFLAGEILTASAKHAKCNARGLATTLELLKLRLGGKPLRNADIMLGDVVLSRRLNHQIHGAFRRDETSAASLQGHHASIIDSLVMSRQFWPSDLLEKVIGLEEKLNGVRLHEEMQTLVEAYQQQYKAAKQSRYLIWLMSLSRVELDVELDDGHVVSLSNLNPVHASVLLYVAEQHESNRNKTSWTLQELSDLLGLDEEAMSSVMHYFLACPKDQRVLRQVNTQQGAVQFVLISGRAEQQRIHEDMGVREAPRRSFTGSERSRLSQGEANESAVMQDEEAPSAASAPQLHLESTILSILQNFDRKSLEELRDLLGMFDLDVSLNELAPLMVRLTQEGKVLHQDGMYLST